MSDRGSAPPSPGAVDGPGRLDEADGSTRITFRRVLPHPIEEVWAAITEPEQVAAWFLVRLRREDGPGARIEMDHANGTRATGRVLEWRPPLAYEYEWNLAPSPYQPEGESSTVRWELTPSDGGTLLVMTHRRLSRPTAEIFVRGFRVLLDRLSAHLDGRPMPEPPWARPPPAA